MIDGVGNNTSLIAWSIACLAATIAMGPVSIPIYAQEEIQQQVPTVEASRSGISE
jgi:hypothetical protein